MVDVNFKRCLKPAVKTCTTDVLVTSHLSAAWRNGSERRFYDDHDRKVNGLTPNLLWLLCLWIRCFTMIIPAWWNLASSKRSQKKIQPENLGNKSNLLLSESGFVQRIASPPLFRDRKIKMKKPINQFISLQY